MNANYIRAGLAGVYHLKYDAPTSLNRACAARTRGDAEMAVRYYADAMEIFRELDAWPEIARCQAGIGWIAVTTGDYDQAQESLAEALRLNQVGGQRLGIARGLEAFAALAAALGEQRPLVIARELTKRFESVHRSRLGDAAAWLAADPDRLRGEFEGRLAIGLRRGHRARTRHRCDHPAAAADRAGGQAGGRGRLEKQEAAVSGPKGATEATESTVREDIRAWLAEVTAQGGWMGGLTAWNGNCCSPRWCRTPGWRVLRSAARRTGCARTSRRSSAGCRPCSRRCPLRRRRRDSSTPSR